MRTIHLPIAEPCFEDWNAMHPVAGGKHCDRCEKQVWDLSAMTETEARALLASRVGERICVRYRHDGERIRFRAASKVGVGAGAALAVALAACTPHGHPSYERDVAEEPAPCAAEVPTIPGPPREALGETSSGPSPSTVAPPPPAVAEPQVKMGRHRGNEPKMRMGRPLLNVKGGAIVSDSWRD